MKKCLVSLFTVLFLAGTLYAASVRIGIQGASNKFSSNGQPINIGAYGIISSDSPMVTFTFRKAPGDEQDRIYVIMEILNNNSSNKTCCYYLKRVGDNSGLFYKVETEALTKCDNVTLNATKALSILASSGSYTYTLELKTSGYNAPVNIYSILVDNASPTVVKKIDFKTYLVNPEGASPPMFGYNNTNARFNLQP